MMLLKDTNMHLLLTSLYLDGPLGAKKVGPLYQLSDQFVNMLLSIVNSANSLSLNTWKSNSERFFLKQKNISTPSFNTLLRGGAGL